MDGHDFYTRICNHGGFEWLGVRDGKTPENDEVLIQYKKTGAKFAVAVSAILDESWDTMLSVLSGKRSPRVMTHLTRIVGYYSQVHNWNRSKLAELRDRQKGNYGLQEEPLRIVAPTSTPQVAMLEVAVPA